MSCQARTGYEHTWSGQVMHDLYDQDNTEYGRAGQGKAEQGRAGQEVQVGTGQHGTAEGRQSKFRVGLMKSGQDRIGVSASDSRYSSIPGRCVYASCKPIEPAGRPDGKFKRPDIATLKDHISHQFSYNTGYTACVTTRVVLHVCYNSVCRFDT